MRLRLGNMRGLDLKLFDFDYDLTWFALMFDPDGTVLGRFGGRDPETPGKHHSLPALRYSLEQALDRFQRGDVKRRPTAPARKADDYAAAQLLSPKACIHCHHVHEFQRESALARGTWKKEDLWIYPDPEALGLRLLENHQRQVLSVSPKSPAARSGLRNGDTISSIDGQVIASIADMQHALHRAPARGSIRIVYTRRVEVFKVDLELPDGWRQGDLSWRWSLKSLKPDPPVQGEDLTAEEKSARGLAPEELAFRQGPFVSTVARQAGIRIGDVIVGIDGKSPALTARQFEAFVRVNYRVGDTIHVDVLRGKERVTIALKLPG